MSDDPSVAKAAQSLIGEYGRDAASIAVRRAINLDAAGAKLAAWRWRRIAVAVRVIEIRKPKLRLVR